jgi:hypothetical protein
LVTGWGLVGVKPYEAPFVFTSVSLLTRDELSATHYPMITLPLLIVCILATSVAWLCGSAYLSVIDKMPHDNVRQATIAMLIIGGLTYIAGALLFFKHFF